MAHRRRTDPAHRRFTIDQANATLPLVRAIVDDAVTVAHEVDQRRQRIGPLLEMHAGQSSDTPDPYFEEVIEVKRRLDEDRQRLTAYQQELAELGVRLVDPLEGHVEFPTKLEQGRGYLCWKPGETEIRYWRPDRATRRRRLPMVLDAAGGSVEGDRSESFERGK